MDYFDKLLNAYEPTEEDIKKTLTDEQLVKLCRRTNCRVDLWKWNSVGNVAESYREDGRFKGKSQKFINKLMLKTYQRNPEFFKHDEEERNNEWYKEWTYRKKKTLMQLDVWQYDEETAQGGPSKPKQAQKQQHPPVTSSQEQYLVESPTQKAGRRMSLMPKQAQKRQHPPVTSSQEQYLVESPTQKAVRRKSATPTTAQKSQHPPVTSSQEQHLVESPTQKAGQRMLLTPKQSQKRQHPPVSSSQEQYLVESPTQTAARRKPATPTTAQKLQHPPVTSSQEQHLVESPTRKPSTPKQSQKRQHPPVTSSQEHYSIESQTQTAGQTEALAPTQVQKHQRQPVTSTQELYLVDDQRKTPLFVDPRYIPGPISDIKLEDSDEFIEICGGVEPFTYVSEHTATDEQRTKVNLKPQKQTGTEDNSLLNELKYCESESISLSTDMLTERTEELGANLIAVRLSELLESPLPAPSQTPPCSQPEPFSQPNTYDDFHQRIPQSSTQELFD